MKSKPNNKRRTMKAALLSCASGAAMASGGAALAQSVTAASDSTDNDTIVVTGSRIPRPDLAGNSPVQVIDGAEFQLTTRLEVDELLNHVPSISVPNGATTNSEGNGRAAVSLRNLGTSRTLVLINNRRVVGSSTSGVVDINSISPGLIERIEVVTGGASAVYGSDAMAGVVNFILKDNFEGMTARGQYGITEQGDGARYGVDVTLGMNSADGRGNIIVNGGYMKRERILAGERPFSAFALDESDSASSCAANASGPGLELGLATEPPCLRIGGSSRIPGTLLRLRGTPEDLAGNPTRATDPNGTSISSGRLTFNEDGSVRARLSEDVFNFNPFVNLLLPLERYTLSSIGRYDVTDNIRFFAEGMYTNSLLDWRQAPFAVDVEDRPGQSDLDVQVSINNPFIDPATQAFLAGWDDGGVGAGPDGVIGTADDTSTGTRDLVAGDNIIVARQFRRRPLEAGPRRHINRRNTYRFVAGFQGDLGETMNWEVFYNYGKHERVVRRIGRFSETRMRQAVLLNPAGTACANPIDGCVPVNFFGPNTMTEDQLAFLTYEANSISDIVQHQAGALLGGELPGISEAGAIGYSLGVEWRDHSASFNPDFASRSLEADEPISGSFDVKEAFGEVVVPILSGMTGAEYLGLEAGARVSDYSNAAGTVFTFKGGGEWRPLPDVKVRGLFQRATRAPNINELFSPLEDAATEATDMCQDTPGSQRQTNAAIDAFCDAEGVPDGYVQDQNQINIRDGGNPNLKSETSNTWTVGLVYTPEAVPSLMASVDYYSIKITDGISQFGGGLTGTFAACSADPRSGNPFCDALVRNPDGDIDAFFTVLPNANASIISTKGIDAVLAYQTDLPDNFGTLSLNATGTYVLEDIFSASEFTAPNDCVGLVATRGLCGEGVPHFLGVTDLTHNWGGLTSRLRYRYVGEIGSELVAFDAANGLDRSDAFTTVGAEHYFDLFFGYEISDNLEVNFTMRNVFDNDPPLIGDAGGEPNIDSQLHDPLGRRFTFAVQAKF